MDKVEGREFQLPPTRRVLEIGPGTHVNPSGWVDDLGDLSGTHLVLIDVRNLPQLPDFDPDYYLDSLHSWEFIPGEASAVISMGDPRLPAGSFDRIVMNNVLTAYGNIDLNVLIPNTTRLLNHTGEFVMTEDGLPNADQKTFQYLITRALSPVQAEYGLTDESVRGKWKIVIRPK